MGCHSFLRGSSSPRDRAWVSCIAGRFFTVWARREAPLNTRKWNRGELPKPFAIHSYPAGTFKPAADSDEPAHSGFPGILSKHGKSPSSSSDSKQARSTSQQEYLSRLWEAAGHAQRLPVWDLWGPLPRWVWGSREASHHSLRKQFPSPSSSTHSQRVVSGFLSLR